MADVTTIHKVILQFGVQKGSQVVDQVNRVGEAAKAADKKVEKAAGGLKRFLGGGPIAVMREIPGLGQVVEQVNGLSGALQRLAMQKLSIPQSIGEWVARGWELNEAWDQAQDKLVGTTLAMTAIGQTIGGVKVEFDRMGGMPKFLDGTTAAFERAGVVADALRSKFRETAMEAAVPTATVRTAFGALLPMLSGVGKSWANIAELSGDATKAAVVFGQDAGAATSVVIDLLRRGRSRSKDPLGLSLSMEAGIKKTDTMEQKIVKVGAALKKLAAPIKAVTDGTEEATVRWKIFLDGVIQRSTKAAYDTIGDVVQKIVDWTELHKDAIDGVIDGLTHAWEVGSDFVGLLVEGAVWLSEYSGLTGLVGDGVSVIVAGWQGLVGFLDSAVQSFKVIREVVRYMTGESSWAKLDAMLDGLYLKMLKIVRPFVQLLKILPGGAGKIAAKNAELFDTWLGGFERQTAAKEKAAGVAKEDRVADAVKKNVGMTKAERDQILKDTLGTKRPLLEQNIGKIEVHQDLRDQDPDRVFVEFKEGLEKLGERALSSTAAGRATAFGPG